MAEIFLIFDQIVPSVWNIQRSLISVERLLGNWVTPKTVSTDRYSKLRLAKMLGNRLLFSLVLYIQLGVILSACPAQDSGRILTAEIAAQFVANQYSVNLQFFTSIEDGAAEALSKHGGYLKLDGLTELSDAQAEALAKHEGDLYLDGLTSLSDAQAEALSKHEGDLYLDGLTELSDAQAGALAKHEGELSLDGLTSLSDAQAEALAKHLGGLALNGLTELSDNAAEALAKHQGYLYLNGLTELSDISHSASRKNLKEIGLALHNYHDTYKRLPNYASTDMDGKPLLSWRVHLLPYLEQQQLYSQFHLDEPWDSEHNIKLVKKMPQVFRSHNSQALPGYTNYVTIRSNDSMFPALDKNQQPRKEGIRFRDIIDGLGNTLMVVEANDNSAVIWTQPNDLVPDNQTVKRMVGLHRHRIAVLMADGWVTWLPSGFSNKNLMRLITRAGQD
jgi:hypothetical protein